MKFLESAALAVGGALISCELAASGIGGIADLNRELAKKFEREQAFCVTATVVSVSNSSKPARYASDRQRQFYVQDGHRYSLLFQLEEEGCAFASGDRVRFEGRLKRERYGWSKAMARTAVKVGDARVPMPEPCDAIQLQDPARLFDYVRMEGVLVHMQTDDIDPSYVLLFLRGDKGAFVATIGRRRFPCANSPSVGDRVELVGRAEPTPSSGRRHFQSARIIVSRVNVLQKAPSDLFSVPGIDDLDYANAATLERLGLRKADGRVVAVLLPDQILLRTSTGRCIGEGWTVAEGR